MPMAAVRPEVIRDAVLLANRAPSVHNSQPWRWVVRDTGLQLWADPCRRMPATDRLARELMLSCGAVLDHLRVAMAAAGWRCHTERLPDPQRPDHLATLWFRPSATVTAAQRRRAAAVGARRSDRLPFGPPPGWPVLESVLRETVRPFEVMLDVVGDGDRPRLADESALIEQLRRADTNYLEELRWWTSPFESDATHVPEDALVSSAEAALVDIARSFPPVGGRHRGAFEPDRSRIVVLSTPRDDARLEVLRCGEALSAVLLECTVAGAATCTLTHLTEIAESRRFLARIVGTTGEPQVLIRVGRATGDNGHPHPTPRRLVTEILTFR